MILGGGAEIFFASNWEFSSGTKLGLFDSSWPLFSEIVCATCSGYGQMRINNQPSIIGDGVPSARMNRKSEVFPGKIVRAIIEKRKADNPSPEITTPVTEVLYIKERVSVVTTINLTLELTILSGKLFMTALSAAL